MCLSLAVRLRLAFANMLDAAVFSILLQRKLPQLPWPEGLKQRGDLDEGGDGFLLQIWIDIEWGALGNLKQTFWKLKASHFFGGGKMNDCFFCGSAVMAKVLILREDFG